MRSPFFEQTLALNGLEYTYAESLPLAQIDQTKSLRNQARLTEPIAEDLVSVYATADKLGEKFPPLVVWRPGGGKWILIDGNQRYAAYLRNGKTHSDAYLVHCKEPRVIDRVTWTFNNKVNGRRLTAKECMQHAITYVRKYSAKTKEAALEWGVDQNDLIDAVRRLEARETLVANGVKLTESLTDSKIDKLNQIRGAGEDLFVSASQVVATSGVAEPEVDNLIRNVKKAKTSEDKAKVVEEFAKSEVVAVRKAETKGGTIKALPSNPRTLYLRYLRLVRNLRADHGAKALQPASHEYKIYRDIALEVCDNLTLDFGLGVPPSVREEEGKSPKAKEA